MRFALRFSIVNYVVNILYFGHYRLFLKTTRDKMPKNRIFTKYLLLIIFFQIEKAHIRDHLVEIYRMAPILYNKT